jgi:hypothetical protein
MFGKTTTLPFVLLAVLCLLSACNENETKPEVSKRWKAVSIKNLTFEKEKAYYKILMDTITDKNERLEFFNGSVDSFKRFTNLAFQEQDEMQKMQVDNSFMEFKKNGVAYFTSIDGLDSAKWRQEEDEIVLDAEEFTGIPNTVRFGILNLTADEMILRKVDLYDTNIITLNVRTN